MSACPCARVCVCEAGPPAVKGGLARCRFSLNKAQARQHTVQGLLVAQANMDTVVSTIRSASDGPAASRQLQAALQLSPDQVLLAALVCSSPAAAREHELKCACRQSPCWGCPCGG